MYPVTKAVADQFKTNARQNLSLLVNPVVGESFELTSADILSAGLNINRYSATGDSVALGVCSAADLSLRVENGDGRFNDVVFEGAQIYASVGVEDGNNTQWVPLGYFTVDNAPRRLAVISITALDGMVQFDKLANRSALSLPNSVKNIVRACCNECNITIDTDLDALPNSSFVAQSVGDAEDLTYRTILQWCCQVMGVNGYMDWDGHLELSWYKKDGIPETVSGSIATFESVTEVPVNNLTVPITAVQSFNGYDKPWVGGAGVNKLSPLVKGVSLNATTGAQSTSLTSATTDYIPVNFTTNPNYYISGILNTLYSFIGAYNSSKQFLGRTGGTTRKTESLTSSSFTSGTPQGSGDIAYLRFTIYENTGASGVIDDIDNMKAQLEVGSSATAWTPYENICPISPANGKNLLPKFTSGTSSNLTYTAYPDGSVHVTGTTTGTEFYAVQFTLSKGTYILSGAPLGGQLTIRNARGGGSPSAEFSGILDEYGNGNVAKFTVSATASAWLNIRSTAGTHDDWYYPMIRPAEITSATYVPYKGLETTRTGKNLYSVPIGRDGFDDHLSGTHTTNSDILTVTATSSTNSGVFSRTGSFIRRLPREINSGTTITYSLEIKTNVSASVAVGYESYGASTVSTTTEWQKVSKTITTNNSTGAFVVYNKTGSAVTIYVRNFQFELGSSATAYEPYQGKQYFNLDYNFWDEEYLSGYYNVNDGTFVPVTSRFCSKNYIPVVPSTTYFAKTPSSGLWLLFYDADKTYLGQSAAIFRTNATFTAPSNAYYMQFYAVASYGGTYQNDIQFNYSNPSQVGYGGVLDVETGLLTVTKGYAEFNGDENISLVATYNGSTYQHMIFGFPLSDMRKGLAQDFADLSCNWAIAEQKADSVVFEYCSFRRRNNQAQLILFTPTSWGSSLTLDGLKTMLQTTPIQFVYPLATPQTYQLTPAQVELLKGINNIWADGNSTVSVTFPAVTEITPADRYNSDIYENAVTITGVSVKGKENQAVVGSEDYALAIDGNSLITDDDVETIANGLSGLIGFSYHPFSASVLPMPYLYPLDMVAVQYKDEWYDCAVTEINFTSTAPTQLKGTGESAQSRSYARINPLTNRERAIIENLKDEVNTTLNKAVNNILDFNNIISNALGLYHTNVADGTGGFIRYLHDAPDLESSTYIVTETAQGFAWTTNGWNGGSPIWQYGVTSGGYALFKWLSAEGIDVTRASSDYRAEVTPEHFNIYYKNDLIITIDATDRAIQTPRMVIPYSSTSINSLRVGQLVWIPTPNGANAVVLGS